MKESQIYILTSVVIFSPHASYVWGATAALMSLLFAVAYLILEWLEGRERK